VVAGARLVIQEGMYLGEDRRLSIADISQWIDNDEGLYDWWRRSKLSKTAFIREHRVELEQAINNVLGGQQQAHYLKYGRRDPGLHEDFEAAQPLVAPKKPLLSPPARAAVIAGGAAAVGLGVVWLLSRSATTAPAPAPAPTGGNAGATWSGSTNTTGPAGAKGSVGPSGPTGATGSTGPAGPTGPTGTPGSNASAGLLETQFVQAPGSTVVLADNGYTSVVSAPISMTVGDGEKLVIQGAGSIVNLSHTGVSNSISAAIFINNSGVQGNLMEGADASFPYEVLFETGPLTAGVYTVDLRAEISGSGLPGAQSNMAQLQVMRVKV